MLNVFTTIEIIPNNKTNFKMKLNFLKSLEILALANLIQKNMSGAIIVIKLYTVLKNKLLLK